MKEIYAFALDDEIPLSEDTNSNIREIAFLLYDELNRYDRNILCTEDDNLVYNCLFETYSNTKNKYIYRFMSDKSKTDYRLYEPFIINDRTFAITVYKYSINEDEMTVLIRRIISSLNLKYKFNIKTEEYTGNKINNRYDAIELLNNRLNNKIVKKRVKTRTNSILSVFGL